MLYVFDLVIISEFLVINFTALARKDATNKHRSYGASVRNQLLRNWRINLTLKRLVRAGLKDYSVQDK